MHLSLELFQSLYVSFLDVTDLFLAPYQTGFTNLCFIFLKSVLFIYLRQGAQAGGEAERKGEASASPPSREP